MKDKKPTKADRDAAALEERYGYLRAHLAPGATVYCSLVNVSASGMSRRIRFSVPVARGFDGRPQIVDITHAVCGFAGFTYRGRDGSCVVSGCGMDMGFHAVYSFAHAFFKKEREAGQTHGTRNGEPDADCGYWLKSVWL